MNALTVRIEPADPRRAAAAAATLASLPLSFVEAGRSPDGVAGTDVVVLAGSEGWADRVRATAHAGGRAVIVTDPLPAGDAGTLVALAPACAVALAETWASSPVVTSVVDRFAGSLGRTRLVDARTLEPRGGRTLREVLFAQLRAVQRLGLEVASVEIVAETATSALAVGSSTTGARIVLSAARSDTADGSLDLLLVAPDETIRIVVPDSATARPGRAVLSSACEAIEVPTMWQTAHRTAWLRLRDAVADGSGRGGRLDDVEAFAAATALLPPLSPQPS